MPSSTTEFAQKVKPDWSIVLAYEYKLRKEAMKLVTQQSKTLSEALYMVTKDADLMEAFFRTPIALKAAGALDQQPWKYQKGEHKGHIQRRRQAQRTEGWWQREYPWLIERALTGVANSGQS